MSHLLRGRTATPESDTSAPHPPAPHSHHLRESIAGALSHIPHSLPEPHQHYPPPYPSYLESARMSREMGHL
jgi:hypothetical protein